MNRTPTPTGKMQRSADQDFFLRIFPFLHCGAREEAKQQRRRYYFDCGIDSISKTLSIAEIQMKIGLRMRCNRPKPNSDRDIFKKINPMSKLPLLHPTHNKRD